jgi:L-fuconolactonase
MSLVIDAHHHFWQLGRFGYEWLNEPPVAAIRRDYLPDHLAPLLQSTGVDRSVFVQTQHNVDETRWVLSLAEQYDFIAGVVGWVDLQSPDCERQLEEFVGHPKFVGVRHVVHDEPDDDWIIRPAVLNGLRILERHRVPYDLLFYVKHLKHAASIAKRFPDLPLVIDHLAKPRIKDQAFNDWEGNFRAAAKFPNVWCKLSGMVTEADHQNWKPSDLKPYVDIALDAFGPSRLMYGSDWPVCELAGSYQQVIEALRECVGELSAAEKAAIFGETASQFYRLK